MFTKTQARIMQVFASQITERFSIKQISEIINKPYPLVHRTISDLIKGRFIYKDKQKYLALNYRKNHQELAYVENLRTEEFSKRSSDLALFVDDVLERFKEDFFVFLFFGSIVNKKNTRDIDILFIIPDVKKINITEKILYNVSGNYEQKFDIHVISFESVYEMLTKREELNVMNEVLNKHLICYGAETFYRFLQRGRK